ncbi:MAG: glycosyltransferase family 4 protein [Armatimonadetes bacterium]|nr:glycosyltransferase family 4 protein [Armatimonadota bacterium]
MPTPSTVAFVNHVGLVSGAEQSLLIVLANLDRTRYRPVLICPAGPLAERARALGVEVRAWCGTRLRRRLSAVPRLLRAALLLRPLLADADLIHANSLAAALAAEPWRGRRPLLWHVRDLRMADGPARAMARRADACLAISVAVAERLAALGAPPERVHLLPNALDAADFQPTRTRAVVRSELGLGDQTLVAIVVGQLVPWKGHDDLLAAWALALPRLGDGHLLVVGADLFGEHAGYVAQLRQRAAQPDLAGTVSWLGARQDVADLMAASDVLALPSHGEPFGRVLLEAAAVGLPVVATVPGGPADVVEPGRTGLLVPAGDVTALAEALAELLAMPERQRQAMGVAARARLERHFTACSQGERLIAVYGRLESGASP